MMDFYFLLQIHLDYKRLVLNFLFQEELLHLFFIQALNIKVHLLLQYSYDYNHQVLAELFNSTLIEYTLYLLVLLKMSV